MIKKKICCCHDINSKDCTIKMLNRRFMVSPDIKVGVCKVCGASFQYIKKEDGFVPSEEIENEDI